MNLKILFLFRKSFNFSDEKEFWASSLATQAPFLVCSVNVAPFPASFHALIELSGPIPVPS